MEQTNHFVDIETIDLRTPEPECSDNENVAVNPLSVRVNQSLILITHDEHLLYKCAQCEYRSSSANDMKAHSDIHKSQAERCDICGYETFSIDEFEKHVSCHTDRTKYTCIKCPFKTVSRQHLEIHVLSHSSQTDVPCEIYCCPVCGYVSKDDTIHEIHIKKFHPEKQKRSEKTKTRRRNCDNGRHSEPKPFACIHCNYRSTRKGNLKTHMLVHTKEKNFLCELCNYKAARRSDLKAHLVRHHRTNE